MLLAQRFGEFSDIVAVREALRKSPLVECEDGQFREPTLVYFESSDVSEVLGETVNFAKETSEHKESIRQLLLWLGVAEHPRALDLLETIERATNESPTAQARSQIAKMFAHLGKRWKLEGAALAEELDDLRRQAWLPAYGDTERWYHASEVYAAYQRYLFETQGTFLDVDLQIQNVSAEFVRWLGIDSTPSVSQVVRHLLTCAASNAPVNIQVYNVLEQDAGAAPLSLLQGTACLLLEHGRYVRPDQVFWGEHPFGPYRYRLDPQLRGFGRLFQRLGVRETADWHDAIRMLREVGYEFGVFNSPF